MGISSIRLHLYHFDVLIGERLRRVLVLLFHNVIRQYDRVEHGEALLIVHRAIIVVRVNASKLLGWSELFERKTQQRSAQSHRPVCNRRTDRQAE